VAGERDCGAHGYTTQVAVKNLTVGALDHLTAARGYARSNPSIATWLAAIEATVQADRVTTSQRAPPSTERTLASISPPIVPAQGRRFTTMAPRD
jgi:hypothetical protein